MSYRGMTRALLIAPLLACLIAPRLGAQQDNTELLNRIRAMEQRIQALEAEVTALKTAPTGGPSQVVAQSAPAPAEPTPPPAQIAERASETPANIGGASGAAAKVFNPDISLIGDFQGAAGNHGNRYTPSLEMHESELGLQEVIDPYVRGDVFLTFGEQGVGLEEGYFTFTSLPGSFQLKVGKMRAAFGKVNTTHNHVLPWIDRPLVTQNLVGGEDGIDDAGFSVSRILPAPKGIFLEATAQLFRGDSENVFSASKRSDVSTVGHLRLYRDISESTNLDLGGSYARGQSPFGTGTNQLFGTDLTLRWKPLRRAIYHSFTGRAEFVWARTSAQPTALSILGALLSEAPASSTAKPFGYYASGEYQLGRRWFLGGRFDQSERGQCLATNPASSGCSQPTTLSIGLNPVTLANDKLLRDTGGSLLLTYRPSEFSQIRGQLRRTAYGDGPVANEVLFQFILSMGAHGAHPF